MSIKFKNGSTWNVVGSDNYDSLVGSPPIGVVFSEWALAKPEAWAYLRPILAENDGWAIFIYTPRGPNHGLDIYNLAKTSPSWFGELLTVEDTGAIPMDRLLNERKELLAEWGPEMGEAIYQQEYYCSFEAAVVGAFYGDCLATARREGRITTVNVDPYTDVGTMWDLGYTDSTAIWFFQLVGHQVRFIDYYEAHNVGLEHYQTVLRNKAEQRGYKYSPIMQYFPHDVEVHELTTGMSRRHMLWQLGIPVTTVPKHNIMDGISLVRRNFHRYWFDVERCEKGLKAMAMYRREWDESKRTLDPVPVHDWTSHAADAIRTGQAMLPDWAPRANNDSRENRYRRDRRRDRPPYSRMGH
jgi:phage terminase large subunit